MCGIVGAAAQARHRPGPDRRPAAPRIPRLRLLRRRGARRAAGSSACAAWRAWRSSPRQIAKEAPGGRDRHRAHALGHARRAGTQNAHPMFSRGEIALVHNGIIENHEELRAELKAKGYVFESQTDTEVIAHLVHSLYDGDLFEAVRRAVKRLAGAYAIAVVCEERAAPRGRRARRQPAGGRRRRQSENFLASDALALAGTTDRIVYLEEGDVAEIGLDGFRVFDAAEPRGATRESRTVQAERRGGGARPLPPLHAEGDLRAAARRRRHAARESRRSPRRCSATGAAGVLRGVEAVLILACGTSYYAGLTAKYWIESLARLPTQVEIASEYRYRDSVPDPTTLVVAISQSGETADTLAALQARARRSGRSTRSPSATSPPARWCARRGCSSSPTPASRSASPRPRPSPPSWWRCSCWR